MTHQTNLEVGPAKHTHGGKIGIAFYSDGDAIALTIESDRGVEAKATVNMPEIDLPANHIILKNWSENEGIPEALEKAGLVELTDKGVDNGFIVAPIAKMKEPLLNAIKKVRKEMSMG